MQRTTFSSTQQAQDILRRLEIRVPARLVEVLNNLGEQSISETRVLRQRIFHEAQAVVDEALRQWEHGAEYRVEMVIGSLYWTDASVGRAQPQEVKQKWEVRQCALIRM